MLVEVAPRKPQAKDAAAQVSRMLAPRRPAHKHAPEPNQKHLPLERLMRAASCEVFTSNRSGCCSECRCMSPFASPIVSSRTPRNTETAMLDVELAGRWRARSSRPSALYWRGRVVPPRQSPASTGLSAAAERLGLAVLLAQSCSGTRCSAAGSAAPDSQQSVSTRSGTLPSASRDTRITFVTLGVCARDHRSCPSIPAGRDVDRFSESRSIPTGWLFNRARTRIGF